MARSLNKAQLIGNLTKDPELKYTPQGTPVCNFSVATNRVWKNSKGEKQDEATFHRVIAWSKLAEICSQLLTKGRKVFIEGRIQNRTWDDPQGQKHYISEIVLDELILLDNKGRQVGTMAGDAVDGSSPPEPEPSPVKKEEIEDIVIPDDFGKDKKDDIKEKTSTKEKDDDSLPF